MAKKTTPDFDFTKMAEQFSPARMAEEFAKMTGNYRLPGLDPEAMMEAQRRNVEALTNANTAILEGVRALAQRQAEILQETLTEATAALGFFGKSGTPSENAAQQAEVAKTAFDKGVSNVRELSDMATQSGQRTAEVLNTRIAEGLDEIKTLAGASI